MKKCPFCGADIEDSARFCLYCMTSLTEKEQILVHKNKKPQGLLILVAILGVAIILLLLLLGKRAMPDTESQIRETSLSPDTTEVDTVPTIVPTTEPTTEQTAESTEATEEETEPTEAETQPSSKPSSTPSTQPSQPTPPETEPTEPSEPTHSHSFTLKRLSEQYLKRAADCTNPATYYYSCTCGQHGDETFSSGKAKGHTLVKLEGYPAHCMTEGLTDGTYCSVCQVVTKKQETIAAPGHIYAFSEFLINCENCFERQDFAIYTRAYYLICRNWEIQDGYYILRIVDGVYYITMVFTYQNKSDETVEGYPIVSMATSYSGTYLKPGQTGRFYASFQLTNPSGVYYLTIE